MKRFKLTELQAGSPQSQRTTPHRFSEGMQAVHFLRKQLVGKRQWTVGQHREAEVQTFGSRTARGSALPGATARLLSQLCSGPSFAPFGRPVVPEVKSKYISEDLQSRRAHLFKSSSLHGARRRFTNCFSGSTEAPSTCMASQAIETTRKPPLR